ncbi:MAG: DUF2961 domain-containing protein [Armatimonadetes bacterium]|nr:DUF2961 domain-containing protein [Candidatus Hippobium faecium]
MEFNIPEKTETRWASCENPGGEKGRGGQKLNGRKGAAFKHDLLPGEIFTLAEYNKGCGIVRRMWITVMHRNKTDLLGLVLRIYWDNEDKPAVEVPLGNFFCQPLGIATVFQNVYFDNPEGRSFVCRIPMPFIKGFRMTLTNESDVVCPYLFYDVNWTINDDLGERPAYFHSHYRREEKTALKKDFEILPYTEGEGRFLGCSMGVIVNQTEYQRFWWGEGEVKMYIDGDKEFPTLCGTGTEDYISTAWGQGLFSCMWHGCPLADNERMKFGFYRFHGPDPVYFHKNIRVTIQQIGCPDPKISKYLKDTGKVFQRAGYEDVSGPDTDKNEEFLFERSDDWCATSYYYLNSPTDKAEPIIPYSERINNID